MVGTTISHYKVLEKIGQGGMGTVYRAQDTTLDREVAIKVLPEQFTQDSQRLARFEREAKLLASLNHPNIAAIHSFEHSDDIHFLVLELVEGETLAELVSKGPQPVEEALEVCRQIAEGVEAAHEKGVIHRDLKPANVKITPEGKVKILDFGLAKAFETEIPATDISQSPTLTEEMTRAGVILGTAAYMSPEQAKGKSVDRRADIFAFGCVLYELLTGKKAFEGETITETLAKVLEGEPDWEALPVPVPSIIRFVLSRCFEKDPNRRLQHIDGARILIEEALTGSTAVSPAGLTGAVQSPLWRRAVPWISAVLMAVVTGIAVWSVMRWAPQPVTKLVITPPQTAPLANGGGIDVAISPDGRKIVYRVETESSGQLYVRSLDELAPAPISGTEGALSVFFSPDGESVAFSTSDKLKKVSLLGGPSVTVSDVASFAGGSWGSEDTIVFSQSGEGGNLAGLYRVSTSGGEAETLTVPNADQGEIGYRSPEILPGGKAVLFTIFGGDGWQSAVLSLETGEKKIVVQGGRQARYANTGHLVYEVAVSGALMAVPFSLARLEVTGDPLPVLEGVRYNPSFEVDFAFSSKGTLVYVPLRTNEQSLVWVDREGTERVITQEKRTFGTPRLSPDGMQISVTVYEEDGSRNVWIYDLEGDSFSRLTFEGDFNTTQVWSPDGKWIVFQSGREALRSLSRQLADGSGRVEQLTIPSPLAPITDSFSPDGSVMAFSWGTEIWVLPMEGEREPRFLMNGCCAAFSPDGRFVAYVSNDETGRMHVYVSPYLEPEVKRLVSGEQGGGQPVWSPDGKELFYRSGDRMMVVSVQMEPTFSAGRPRVLFAGSYVKTQFQLGRQYYDITPDGRLFVMIREGGESQINVVLNWFEELKRLVPSN